MTITLLGGQIKLTPIQQYNAYFKKISFYMFLISSKHPQLKSHAIMYTKSNILLASKHPNS